MALSRRRRLSPSGRFLPNPGVPAAQISDANAQTIPDGGADTPLTFDTEDFNLDDSTFTVDLANNRIQLLREGTYQIVHALAWDGNAGITERRSRATAGGAPFEPLALSPGSVDGVEGSFVQFLEVTATPTNIGVVASQTGVAAGLDVTALRLTVIWLD